MNQANALEQLTGLCTEPLASDPRPRAALARAGITESFVFESFRLGYCADQVAEHLARDQELRIELERCGAIKNGRVVLQGSRAPSTRSRSSSMTFRIRRFRSAATPST